MRKNSKDEIPKDKNLNETTLNSTFNKNNPNDYIKMEDESCN